MSAASTLARSIGRLKVKRTVGRRSARRAVPGRRRSTCGGGGSVGSAVASSAGVGEGGLGMADCGGRIADCGVGVAAGMAGAQAEKSSRKREEGRRKREEGRRKKEEGRGKKGRRVMVGVSFPAQDTPPALPRFARRGYGVVMGCYGVVLGSRQDSRFAAGRFPGAGSARLLAATDPAADSRPLNGGPLASVPRLTIPSRR
ncbi:MAG: hypothetical protein HY784_01515, partial [Chloroflexi bacterium]|nr:hypothetical protein [Chloroflexota bacterium]